MGNKRFAKATNDKLSRSFIAKRKGASLSRGFEPPKYLLFCEFMMDKGFTVFLYEARQTVSKYVTLKKDCKEFKVRFSNHKPNKGREIGGDCDFFVGITHTGVRTTRDAYFAALEHFGMEHQPIKRVDDRETLTEAEMMGANCA